MAMETCRLMKSTFSKQIEIALALSVLICLKAAPVRADGFTVVGPGGGGAMFHATINPRDANEALIACDMTGSYITHDGGRSWRMFNLRGTVRFFAFDPLRAGTMYAGTQGLWRSTDDGESWKLVWPQPSTVRDIRMNSDHADETFLSAANPVGEVVALAIDPADSDVLVAGAVKGGAAAVFVSTDVGKTWKKERDLPGAPEKRHMAGASGTQRNDIYGCQRRVLCRTREYILCRFRCRDICVAG